MEIKAVITGDIVHSRRVGDISGLLAALKQTIQDIAANFRIRLDYEIYRGDSFQILVENPERAMDIAILIRSGLRNSTPLVIDETRFMPIENLWDTRVSIGIGRIEYPADKIVESSGEAYKLSGMQLDNMKKSPDRIRMLSTWNDLNEQFEVLSSLADAIIGRWTYHSSQATYRYLLYHETQKQISEYLGISQPAVHNRLNISNIDAIEKMLNYLNQLIKSRNNGT